MIRRPPRSTLDRSSAASDVYKRQTFALKALLWKDWQAEVDIDFAEAVSTNSQVELRDMWVKYTFPKFNLSLLSLIHI